MLGIDLFAGAGGMSYGAIQAGVKIQTAVDIDELSLRTYKRNHQPEYGVHLCDISKLDTKAIKYGNRQDGLVIFGGPPCQGFSTSNQRTRSRSNQRNWLFEEFVRFVRDIEPDYLILENVKGILETENGFFVEQIADSFIKLGYDITTAVLDSEKFGVPQRRSRFFMVGSKGSKTYSFPKPEDKNIITVSDAISDLPILNNGNSECYQNYRTEVVSDYARSLRGNMSGCNNHLVSRNNQLVLERYRHVKQGGNWENIPERLMTNYSNRNKCHTGIYRRLKSDEPSVVIGNYRKNMLIHPTQDRGLSVREAARLQSFPDNFIFEGSIGFQQQQVGNAVPPTLAKQVFKGLMSN